MLLRRWLRFASFCGMSEAISDVNYGLGHKYMARFFGLQEILHSFTKWLIDWFIAIVHCPWRLVNATKFILDITCFALMYMCISGRCRLNGIIFFSHFWADCHFLTHFSDYLKHKPYPTTRYVVSGATSGTTFSY